MKRVHMLLLLFVVCLASGLTLMFTARATQFYVASYFLLSLAAAVVLYGFLESVAHVNREGVKLVGAIAGFVVVFVIVNAVSPATPQRIRLVLKLDDAIVPIGTEVRLLGTDFAENKWLLSERDNGRVTFPVSESQVKKVEIEITVPQYLPVIVTVPVNGTRAMDVKLNSADLKKRPHLGSLRAGSTSTIASRYGAAAPPEYEAELQGDEPQSLLEVRIAKASEQSEQGEHLQGSLQTPVLRLTPIGKQLNKIGIVPRSAIEKRYPQYPFANYVVEAWLRGSDAARLRSEFNYAYCEGFDPGSEGTVFSSKVGSKINSGGARTLHMEGVGRVSLLTAQARLKRRFDFHQNFVISGALILKYETPTVENPSPRATFAIGMGDGKFDVDQVIVLLGEADTYGYTIKLGDEKVDKDENHGRKPSHRIVGDGESVNFFDIIVTSMNQYSTRCEIRTAVNRYPEVDDDVYTRTLPAAAFNWSETAVRLMLYGTGTAIIRDLEIAELPRSTWRYPPASANLPIRGPIQTNGVVSMR